MAYAKTLIKDLAMNLKNFLLFFANLHALLRLSVSNKRIAKINEAPCLCAILCDCREWCKAMIADIYLASLVFHHQTYRLAQ